MALDSKALFLKMFCTRFGSHVRTDGSTSWRPLSQFHLISDEDVLASIARESKAYRALVVDKKESFLILQFNSAGRDADRETWKNLRAALQTAGLPGAKLFQTLENATYQVFINFSKTADILPLSRGLTNHLVLAGITNVEVLRPGNHFILPLQEGYRWMNDDVLPVIARHEMSEVMALNFFMGEVNKTTTCPERLLGQFADYLAEEAKKELLAIVPPEAAAADVTSGGKPKRKDRKLRAL
jgi:hypothetical protein